MTNTVYFHDTLRDGDGDSVSTTEESPATSRHETPLHHHIDFIAPSPLSEGGKLEYSHSKSFSFKELRSATRKFHHDGLLGWGSFGKVYKGWIDGNSLTATKPGKGIAVAIKRPSQHSIQGHDEWRAEVKYLGKLYHPNLVRLFGYCLDSKEHLLVYEFMPRGSLDNHLYERYSLPLSWSVRMKIALGAAKGLAFLHSAAINIIRRSVTSSNILLDSSELKYLGRFSHPNLARLFGYCTDNQQHLLVYDFSRRGLLETHLFKRDSSPLSWSVRMKIALGAAKGLAFLHSTADYNARVVLPRHGPSDMNHYPTLLDLSTKVAKDLGFLAPESAFKDQLTAKSDVYSFGAVLLELLSGRRAIDMRLYLFSRANRCSEHDIFCFLDSHLAGQYSLEKALKAANLALQCLAERPEFRPNMEEAVATLEELQVCEDMYRYPTQNDIFR